MDQDDPDLHLSAVHKLDRSIRKLQKTAACDMSTVVLFDTPGTPGIPLASLHANSVSRFSVYLRLVHVIKACIDEGRIATKRDIYYDSVELFQSQGIVDACIERIASHFLDVPRDCLNVVAAQKGLVYGHANVHFTNRDSITIEPSTTLVPYTSHICDIQLSPSTKQVLVVEKEAVFTSLCGKIPNTLVITGKGYPDYMTQDFVRLLEKHCVIPIYICVDADPYGVHIAATYKYRSFVRAASLRDLGSSIRLIGVSVLDFKRGYLTLDAENRKKALSLISVICDRQQELDCEEMSKWKLELQRMMFLGKIAEMNTINGVGESHVLAEYIIRKMAELSDADS